MTDTVNERILDGENTDENSSPETREAPLHRRDGWRAWLVCFSAFVSNILILGSASTFGVIYPVLLDEFKEGKGITGMKKLTVSERYSYDLFVKRFPANRVYFPCPISIFDI